MTETGDDRAGVPTPSSGIYTGPRWYHRKRTWLACCVVLVLVAAAIGWWRPWSPDEPIRVTDGSERITDDRNLDAVVELIRAQNRAVAASTDQYVSIAVLLPLRTDPRDVDASASVLHELQGAYLAQYWANREQADEGRFTTTAPLVRLLLADLGEPGEDWQETVAQLADLEETDNLVAVAGLGSSYDSTQAAVADLSGRGIPMFGATITSSELAAERLARVSPTNADEAAAAVHHLMTTQAWRSATPEAPYRALLVQDTASIDSYPTDLGAAYRDAFAGDAAHILDPVQLGFDGSADGAGNTLAQHANRVCSAGAQVVFFAGRGNQLRNFLGRLAEQSCVATRPVTVITGDDIDLLTNVPKLWVGDGITLLYTGLASPQSWQPEFTDGGRVISPVPIERFGTGPNQYQRLFTNDDLEDGHAIMAHDAVLTATEAARRVWTVQDPVPTPEALVNGLHQINAQAAVPGASGWIFYQPTPERPGWLPHNKAIPVMRLDRDGKAHLVELSSREGRPPRPPNGS